MSTGDLLRTRWAMPLRLEQKVAVLQERQQEAGWQFDIESAKQRAAELTAMLKVIDDQLMPRTKPRVIPHPTANERPFLKSGGYAARTIKDWGPDCSHCVGPYQLVYIEPMNLDSVSQMKEFLYTIGWEPDEWNFDDDGNKTSPKLTESSLMKLEGETGELICRRYVYTHRLRMILGFLENVREDGRIEARANTLGTPTARYTHSIVVNVPKAQDDVFFGKEIRSLFIAKPGYVLVGCDAKGLENRIMGHYVNDRDMINTLLSTDKAADFHTLFWSAIKEYCGSRTSAKNIEYA